MLQELKNYIGKLIAQNWKNYEDFNELSCPWDTILYETGKIALF